MVILFCVAITMLFSCESKSGRDYMSVKIVLDRHTKTTVAAAVYKQFRVHKIGDSSVYFWTTTLPYEAGDTTTVKLRDLMQ